LKIWKFGKHEAHPAKKPQTRVAVDREQFPISYGMMVKGSIAQRRGKPIRQFGVSVNGTTRVVTSGDIVDRTTYEALLEAGAISKPNAAQGGANASGQPGS